MKYDMLNSAVHGNNILRAVLACMLYIYIAKMFMFKALEILKTKKRNLI